MSKIKKLPFLKVILASTLVCLLVLFDDYLYLVISLFFDFDFDLFELTFHRVSTWHAIEASIIAYAVVFPATVIMASRVFRVGKNGIKCVLAAALTLSSVRFILILSGTLITLNPVGCTASLIILAAACYLIVRFYGTTLPDGMHVSRHPT